MQDYLTSLTFAKRQTIARDSLKALRDAWPNRHTSWRASHVVRANVAMLRQLRAI